MLGSLSKLLKDQRTPLIGYYLCCPPLNAGQDSGYIIRRTPSVLQNVEAEFSGGVDVGVEHLADELDLGRLVGILLFELHHKSKGAIFKGSVCGADDDGVPTRRMMSICVQDRRCRRGRTNQVMTLSGTGEAETPAGGSVCMRYRGRVSEV